MFRFACSFVVVACFALSAVGDIPPPPPERGFKRVPYVNLLKLEAELQGYKFYTFQRMGLGGQETIGDEIKLGTETGIPIPSTSSPSVRTGVVAVPEKVLEDLKTTSELAKLLSRDNQVPLPAGVVVYEARGTTQDLKVGDPRIKVENVITVSPDEMGGVKFVAAETPASPGQTVNANSAQRPQYGMLIAGLAATLAIVTLGIWYARRK